MTEADVQGDVIEPLLRRLGYEAGTDNDIIRQKELRYPRISLGRKKPKSDPLLPGKGKPDYVLQIKKTIRWILEAKAPSAEITADEVEQAYTYASHPEICGVYFAVCNGYQLRVYQTEFGPDAQPLLTLSYGEIEKFFGKLVELLGPEQVLGRFPRVLLDSEPPLGPGLKSSAKVLGGYLHDYANSFGDQVLKEIETPIVSGQLERLGTEQLELTISVRPAIQSLRRFNERFELSSFSVRSESTALSINALTPTKFQGEKEIFVPIGTPLPNLLNWQEVMCAVDLNLRLTWTLEAYLDKGMLRGQFERNVLKEFNLVAKTHGEFLIQLS